MSIKFERKQVQRNFNEERIRLLIVGLFRIKMNNDNGVINLVFVSVFFFCLVLCLCLIYVQRWGIYTLECHV